MITQLTPIPEFLGLITHVDPSQVPLGGAIKIKNMAQLSPGRLRRIPGVTALSSPTIDAQTRIPLAFWARGLGSAGEDQLVAIFMGATSVAVVNVSTGVAMSGPTLITPSFAKQWTATFYNNKWMFAGGGNETIYQLDSSTAYSRVQETAKAVTITIASPAVMTSTNHGYVVDDAVVFATTGALPTGLVAGTVYYVISAGLTTNNFEVSATKGGTAINTSGTQSGTHTVSGLAVGGNLIQSFLNRLYVADIAGYSGLVAYTDVLTTNFTNFPTGNIVNVKELPGDIQALAVNSPTTDKEGIYTQLIIAKHTAIWNYDEIRKDVVSQIVGISNSHVAVNTEAGLIFVGHKGTRHSVFWLPVGGEGEPVDIGMPLEDYFNGTNIFEHTNEVSTVHAVAHGRFYKLFYSTTGQNNNPNELWLDIELLASDKKVRWYGPHNRGSFDASVVAGSTLELFIRGLSGSNKRYQENISADSNFVDASGTSLTAELDLPMNVDPQYEEKVFDVVELQIAKEANISGNQVSVEPIAEGTSQGTQSVSLYDSTSAGISRVLLPFHAAGETGVAARDARIKILQATNQRLDILGASVQYLYNEGKNRVRSKV